MWKCSISGENFIPAELTHTRGVSLALMFRVQDEPLYARVVFTTSGERLARGTATFREKR
jgi:hypothetical protein